MFDSLGSAAFEGVSDPDLRAMEKAAGMPAGTITKQAKTIKEQEIAAKNTKKTENLQFVAANKYNPAGYFDKSTGVFTPFANAGKSPVGRGTGGGSTPSVSKDIQEKAIARYFDTFGEYPSKANIPFVVAQYQDAMNPKGFIGPVDPKTNPFETGRKAQLQYKATSAKSTVNEDSPY